MKNLPKTNDSLLLRTDFSNDTAWNALCTAIQEPNEDGFKAYVDCVSDPAYDGLTIEQLVNQSFEGDGRTFAFIADQTTLSNSELPVLVVDLYAEPGRIFRVTPREMWGVENNLSLGNMDFCEFADSADADGVFRGFSKG